MNFYTEHELGKLVYTGFVFSQIPTRIQTNSPTDYNRILDYTKQALSKVCMMKSLGRGYKTDDSCVYQIEDALVTA